MNDELQNENLHQDASEDVTKDISLDKIIRQPNKGKDKPYKGNRPVNLTGQINDDLGMIPTRRPIGNINPLSVPEKPGWHRRIVNYSTPGNYEEALMLGYTAVKAEEGDLYTPKTQDFSKMSSYMTRHLGGGDIGIVMEMPIEMWKERELYKKEIRKQELSGLKTPEGLHESILYGDIDIGKIE